MSDNLIGATTAIFIVSLSIAVAEPVDVAWSTRDGTAKAGTDYQAANGVVTFLPGETEKQIEVIVYGQNVSPTGDKNFFINLMPPTNAVLGTALIEAVIKVEDEAGVPVTTVIVAQGRRGLKGDPGLSAYDQAVLMGYVGTLEDWMQEQADAAAAAQRASDYAANAAAAATKAENAATAASFLGNIFPTPEAGVDPVTGVQNGAYYNVRSPDDDSFLVEYQNIGGVPTPSGKSYPSSGYVQEIAEYTPMPFVPGKQYHLNQRIMLQNGDVVKNIINGNTADPNVDMTGWYFDNYKALVTTPQMYGAKCDGVTDDTLAVKAWISGAALLKNPSLLLPKGDCLISDTIEFNLPNGSNVQFDGTFLANTPGKLAVRLGQADRVQLYSKYFGLKVRRANASGVSVRDTTDGTIGVEIRNLVEPIVDIRNVEGFREGVVVHGSSGNGGVSYAQVFLGRLVDNGKQLKLMTSGPGWVNENTFYGGRFAYSGSYPTRGDEINISVERTTEQTLNNNVFFRPSLESAHVTTRGFFIDGRYCSVIHPRCENSADFSNYKLEFGPQSEFCEIVGLGFGVNRTNIVDNGYANSYTTKQGDRLVRETQNAPFRSVLTLQSKGSDAATALSVINSTSQVETIKLKQSGIIEATAHIYATQGFRWGTSDLSNNDRGLFHGLVNPEGVLSASVGSIYVARNGSKGTSLYIKELGSGNTGWIAYQGVYSGTTEARPSGVGVGVHYFDTSLNKPIWFNGTNWVDATGATV